MAGLFTRQKFHFAEYDVLDRKTFVLTLGSSHLCILIGRYKCTPTCLRNESRMTQIKGIADL